MANDAIYDMVTERILQALTEGTVPWHKGWVGGGFNLPRSMATGKNYRGVNVFLLGLEGFGSSWWGTYDQIAKLCGMTKQGNRWVSPDGSVRGVRKGEKGSTAVFWKRIVVENKEAKPGEKTTKTIPMLRYFKVFNAEQADGLPEKYYNQPLVVGEPNDPITEAEAIVAAYFAQDNAPSFEHNDRNRAFYRPSADMVNVPPFADFPKAAEYYSTVYHEMGHSTGAPTRLAREGIVEGHSFGDELYSKEELVAEMTAAMLCTIAGIDQTVTNNSAAYIASWLKKLQGDHHLVVQAAGLAQKACDLILGISWDKEDEQ